MRPGKFAITIILISLATPALAGVDDTVYGSEDLFQESMGGEMIRENEDDLYFKDSGNQIEDLSSLEDPVLDPDPLESDLEDQNSGSAPVPEPATGILLGMGALGLARLLRRKKKS